jgi:hypothetical protein
MNGSFAPRAAFQNSRRVRQPHSGWRSDIVTNYVQQRWRDPHATLGRFQAKWRPVRVKKTRQIKNLEPRFDSIEAEKALAASWRFNLGDAAEQ